MSFFTLSDNTSVETDGQFETGGGNIEPIPAGTSVLAMPDEAKVDDYQGESFISIRWTVLAPKEYENRKIFQKVRVFDADTKKADKAKRMLAAIDANAGGKLLASGQEPDDKALMVALLNKPMVLQLQVWELDDKSKSGNWVSAVAPRKQGATQQAQPQKEAPAPQVSMPNLNEDDIPF
jgi:hypothetical protein